MNAASATGGTVTPTAPSGQTPRIHHVAIQTSDIENCKFWYEEFFGCEMSWSQTRFSALTLRRLPGIRKLVEMKLGNMCFHLFELSGSSTSCTPRQALQFQHVCILIGSEAELMNWRNRWLELLASGRYRFVLPDPPTEIVTDADGSKSFYAFDINGLEFEFTFQPLAAM
jgi:catechol 2,3-dioxygenase-like lactoylglutathione lyase family enzyme